MPPLEAEGASGLQPYRSRVGLEIEMVVVHESSGRSLPVRRYFEALESIKQRRGIACERACLEQRCVALHTAQAECGLDNGFNLLETALAPVSDENGLAALAACAHQELADSLEALRADEACVLNASEHPDCPRNADWYAQVCVPRPIYTELRGYRGWHHNEGIDAKAQNGANTSIPTESAVRALNAMIALAPASIALFANSPLEGGRPTGFKENRMTLWHRVFAPATFPGDLMLSTCPRRPFRDLGDFFHWMFGPGTVTRGLPMAQSYDYKAVATVLPDGDPCLQDFLRAEQWPGRRVDTGECVQLAPQAEHFEYSQIGQFLDARLRYRLQRTPDLAELLRAWEREGGLESLFEACGAQMYIEARAPGAGFADACLMSAAGPQQARSVLLAPIALQRGLLNRLDAATDLVARWGWDALAALREPAMHSGLDDARVRALCAEVLELARDGLGAADKQWLAYADYVLDTGRSAADRMLDTWNRAPGDAAQRLRAVLARHAALHPSAYAA
ncbi:glutamate-cysteine ligase family protein [Candidimonas nitroreducens]|uniref:glutamate--cysteine ligase n=1 Tax=Candidimonas nitroreducens TaxID=683354 RepID=A0A225ML49_9BURK|nr:glutamate-cysteine ligase family protein [Candidimonas nitroreducens]OWT62087.1 hypothetical protein CEY11_09810 [Candidimonas nitroreducens]